MTAKPTLGIVIPAYDPDPARLDRYAGGLLRELGPERLRIELDAADESVAAALDRPGVEVHAVDRRRGKGGAITDGFEALDTDVVAFVDADGATRIGSVRSIVEAVGDGADVAVGSRRHEEAEVTGRSRYREALGVGLSVLARGVLDVRLGDYQCGAKAFRRSAWEAVRSDLQQEGFAWDLEVLALAGDHGLDVQEVPVRWHDEGDSSVDVLSAVREFSEALVSIQRRSPRRGGS